MKFLPFSFLHICAIVHLNLGPGKGECYVIGGTNETNIKMQQLVRCTHRFNHPSQFILISANFDIDGGAGRNTVSQADSAPVDVALAVEVE